jgi:hypothetical protein
LKFLRTSAAAARGEPLETPNPRDYNLNERPVRTDLCPFGQ